MSIEVITKKCDRNVIAGVAVRAPMSIEDTVVVRSDFAY